MMSVRIKRVVGVQRAVRGQSDFQPVAQLIVLHLTHLGLVIHKTNAILLIRTVAIALRGVRVLQVIVGN